MLKRIFDNILNIETKIKNAYFAIYTCEKKYIYINFNFSCILNIFFIPNRIKIYV